MWRQPLSIRNNTGVGYSGSSDRKSAGDSGYWGKETQTTLRPMRESLRNFWFQMKYGTRNIFFRITQYIATWSTHEHELATHTTHINQFPKQYWTTTCCWFVSSWFIWPQKCYLLGEVYINKYRILHIHEVFIINYLRELAVAVRNVCVSIVFLKFNFWSTFQKWEFGFFSPLPKIIILYAQQLLIYSVDLYVEANNTVFPPKHVHTLCEKGRHLVSTAAKKSNYYTQHAMSSLSFLPSLP